MIKTELDKLRFQLAVDNLLAPDRSVWVTELDLTHLASRYYTGIYPVFIGHRQTSNEKEFTVTVNKFIILGVRAKPWITEQFDSELGWVPVAIDSKTHELTWARCLDPDVAAGWSTFTQNPLDNPLGAYLLAMASYLGLSVKELSKMTECRLDALLQIQTGVTNFTRVSP